jgi:hypothetical protein
MDGSYSTHGDLKIYLSKFWSENLRGKEHLEELSVDVSLIFKLTLEKCNICISPLI